MDRLKSALKSLSERVINMNVYSRAPKEAGLEKHFNEAVEWLKRAQDHGKDMGFSYGARFKEPFLPSYPETTGYIIPTLLTISRLTSDKELLRRAIDAGDWEIDIQMETGAVMGGRIDSRPKTPAVFNTGMVMLGWLALYDATGQHRFLKATEKAANWLISIQEANGCWIKGNSSFAKQESTVYNVRVAWALAKYGKITNQEKIISAAVKNGEFTLKNQIENGWFQNCCLTNPEEPLVHTLAYTIRGLLELGILLDREDFLLASQKGADSLGRQVKDSGYLAGRFNAKWCPTVNWCCMTGSAQMCIIWKRLSLITGDGKYSKWAHKVLNYLIARHDITNRRETLRGAVTGSWPVWGNYGRFMVLNWATKFFVDALLASGNLFGRHIFVSG